MVVEWSWSFKFYEWFASQVWSGIVCLVKWGQTLFSFSLLYFWRDRKDTCTHAYKALQIKEIWASSSPDISFVSFYLPTISLHSNIVWLLSQPWPWVLRLCPAHRVSDFIITPLLSRNSFSFRYQMLWQNKVMFSKAEQQLSVLIIK